MQTMRATVFHGVNDIRVDEVPRPKAEAGQAVIRVTLTTVCAPICISCGASTPSSPD